jgi:NAD+ synthetase
MNYEKTVEAIRTELKTYVQKNKIQSLILGVSGGIDSCLCAALARPVCDQLNIHLIGASLPCSTNESSEITRAHITGKAFCTAFAQVSIEKYFINLANDINYGFATEQKSDKDFNSWKIRNGNIKARLRMIYLYNLASQHGGMVLSTDNYTEYLLGFWTLHGDVGDFGMIQNLWKSEVYDIAEWLMANEYDGEKDAFYALKETIEAMATDGLGVTNLGDLGQILPEWTGSSQEGYKEVDRVLNVWLERNGLEETQCNIITEGYKNHPVIRRHLASEFKRNNPTNLSRDEIAKF